MSMDPTVTSEHWWHLVETAPCQTVEFPSVCFHFCVKLCVFTTLCYLKFHCDTVYNHMSLY